MTATLDKDRERADFFTGYFSAKDGPPTEREKAEASAAFERWWVQQEKLCDRCGRRSFMGRPLLKVGQGEGVCIDCFCFLTGMDDRDPLTDPSARSTAPPSEPVVVSSFAEFEQHFSPAEIEQLRDSGVKVIPWWLRLLRWLRVRR